MAASVVEGSGQVDLPPTIHSLGVDRGRDLELMCRGLHDERDCLAVARRLRTVASGKDGEQYRQILLTGILRRVVDWILLMR